MNGPHAGAQPFFLATSRGQRFCMFHPSATGAVRGTVLYIAPFGDEMNKSRRMAALQARQLAALGYAVLMLDLYGCGDSDGELADAGLALWRDDLAAAAAWLAAREPGPLYLWGLRLGGLLALDFAQSGRAPLAGIALWQPVQNGDAFLVQLLRQKLASGMLADAAQAGGTDALRAALRAGETLEIGGYDIAPGLAHDIASLDAGKMAPPACPVAWFAAGSALPPSAARTAAAWPQAELQAVACPQFWSTQEIHEAPELLAATSSWFARRAA